MMLTLTLFGLMMVLLSVWGMIMPRKLLGMVSSVINKPWGIYFAAAFALRWACCLSWLLIKHAPPTFFTSSAT